MIDDPYARKQKWEFRGKAPSGRPYCYSGCGREVPKGLRTSCSSECAYQWRLRNHPQVLASFMLKRDKGVCANCGTDTEHLRRNVTHNTPYEAPDPFTIADAMGHKHPYKTSDELNSRYIRHYSCYEMKPDVQAAMDVAAYMHNREIEIPWQDFQKRHREECEARGFNDVSRRWWEADHIVPVVEGGGGCGPEGYRTLCLPCHRRETAALAARRAAQRRKTRQPELQL